MSARCTDKTIKLWRISERTFRQVASLNVQPGRFGGRAPVKGLVVPRLTAGERSVVATSRRSYSNAHAYHINSISTCADGETFLSADDLRINVWSLGHTTSSFSACCAGRRRSPAPAHAAAAAAPQMWWT